MSYNIDVEEGLGEVFTLEEFAGCVKVGAFIPSDGDALFGTVNKYSYEAFVWGAASIPEGATHVHWFNK